MLRRTPVVSRALALPKVIYFVFLYQRWKYRTDFARPNEFGYSYEGTEVEVPAAGDSHQSTLIWSNVEPRVQASCC